MMGKRWRKGLVVSLVVGVAVFMTGAALADQSYTDPRGDAGVGTDVTGITVTNTASGQLKVQVAVVNPLVANHAIMIFIDADKNQSTGQFGVDYWLYGGPDVGVAFLAWNGSDWIDQQPAGFSVGSAATNVMEFNFTQASLGNTTSFAFFVLSVSVDETGGQFSVNPWDSAPDGNGYFTYDVSTTQCANGKDDDGDGKIDAQDLGCSSTVDDDESDDPVTLKAGKARIVPAKPKAGGKVVVSVPVTRVEAAAPIDGGAVICTARIVGGKALRGAGKVVGGNAVCTFKVPLGTKKGKTIRGTVSVVYDTASAKAPFSFKVA